MNLYLIDVAAGPIIIITAIILLVCAGLMVGLIYLAYVFIKRIKKEEDKNITENEED